MKRYLFQARAFEDLQSITDWLEYHASYDVAESFAHNVKLTALRLAEFPHSVEVEEGSPFRRSLVHRFPNYLMYYVPTSEGIEVVRILHGARHLPSALLGFDAPVDQKGHENES